MNSILAKLILFIIVFDTAVTFASPARVVLIRHGEKPDSGVDLSPRGYLRAQALVGYFKNSPDLAAFHTPVAIYATGIENADSSKRMIETVTPLAQNLGLPVNSTYKINDIAAMVSEIMSNANYDGQMVLICWEHKVLNKIAGTFGVTPQPEAWPGSDFDGVWFIDFDGPNVSGFSQKWQHLLPGDR